MCLQDFAWATSLESKISLQKNIQPRADFRSKNKREIRHPPSSSYNTLLQGFWLQFFAQLFCVHSQFYNQTSKNFEIKYYPLFLGKIKVQM